MLLRCVASRPVTGWRLPPSNSTQITDGCGVGHGHRDIWQLLCFRWWHCYRLHYSRRPAQYIISVKPARSESVLQWCRLQYSWICSKVVCPHYRLNNNCVKVQTLLVLMGWSGSPLWWRQDARVVGCADWLSRSWVLELQSTTKWKCRSSKWRTSTASYRPVRSTAWPRLTCFRQLICTRSRTCGKWYCACLPSAERSA